MIEEYLEKIKKVADNININDINMVASIILAAYDNNKNIFVIGNGGSATTASHFACDINKGVSEHLNKKIRIIPLTDNIATITAYANDIDYEQIFIKQLKVFLEPDDVVIAFSGSGASKNIITAIEYANIKKAITIGITGYDGGLLRSLSHHSVVVPIDDMQIIEDFHLIIVHMIMKMLNKILMEK